jgi:hypothetical protein
MARGRVKPTWRDARRTIAGAARASPQGRRRKSFEQSPLSPTEWAELKLLRKYKAWTTRFDVYLGGTVAICAPGADRSSVSRAYNSRAIA